jgi:hypothetical protein
MGYSRVAVDREKFVGKLYHRRVKMRKVSVLFLILFVVAFLGCTSTPFVTTFMNSDISPTNHAVLSVHESVQVLFIDGQISLEASGQDTDFIDKRPMVVLTPGEHKLSVSYNKTTIDFEGGGYISTDTGIVEIIYTFTGGHFYYIYPNVQRSSVSFHITDETDPSVWARKEEQTQAQKRVDSAKKKLAITRPPSRNTQSVSVGEPTIFEGSWELQGSQGTIFQFKGSTFTQINGNYTTSGTFEFSNGILSITIAQVGRMEIPRWNRAEQKYVYSFTSDETLTLTVGEVQMVFIRQ